MPTHEVCTRSHCYQAVVERGVLSRAAEFIPPRKGKIFVVTTRDVWELHGAKLSGQFPHEVLFYPGGEDRKRMDVVEELAGQMVALGGDRSSLVVAFGGGIVDDVGGFLAAVFMRGVPVIQIPTTLLAQVDAGIGGKTGVNLVSGKNLVGAFHQPLVVLIDPEVLATLPPREYRAGLFEVLKHGIIRSVSLFELMADNAGLPLLRGLSSQEGNSIRCPTARTLPESETAAFSPSRANWSRENLLGTRAASIKDSSDTKGLSPY